MAENGKAENVNLEATGSSETTKASKKKKPQKKDATASKAKPEQKEKKPSKALSKIKAEIAKRKEEEELIRKHEEEEEAKFKEEQRLLEEKEKEEKEKRERKKQKEKERKDRLKAEGKYLTAKQKEDQRRVMQMIQSRGIEVSQDEVKKKPTYTNKMKKKTNVNKDIVKEESTTIKEAMCKPESGDEQVEELGSWQDMAEEVDAIDNANDHKEEIKKKATSSKDTYSQNENLLSEDDKGKLISDAKAKLQKEHIEHEKLRTTLDLRCGVICVLGHVDTGKTKILDKLRNTNVQRGEAGGITQQIGATNVPAENIMQATTMCDFFDTKKMKLPGLLIIDTPGHESFSNLRVRGSSLCDMAILVVDLMHSLEEQTKESIRILRERNTPFVVALNKIDRLYQWKSNPNQNVAATFKDQNEATMNDFKSRLNQVISDFAVMELNVRLYFEDPAEDDSNYIKMVPTSAHSGDGMGDLLTYISKTLETDLAMRISYTEELNASVMEVKEIHGLGTTIDVIVVTGHIREGDTIVVAGKEGPIVTQIRGLLQPAPMSEMRVKAAAYDHFKDIKGAQGVKLIAKDLENAIAGLPLYVSRDLGEELYFKEEVSASLDHALKAISVSSIGVYVVASTIGSLESLLVYLKSMDIPYSGINIGTVHKKDIMKASVMLQRDAKWAVILAFDVKVDREAQKMAQEMNVKIFTSEIIYHLQTQMEQYFEELKRENRIKHRDHAVFPVVLTVLPDMVFNKRAPIVMGIRVEAGLLKVGTPLCVPTRDMVHLGKVFSIESNHKAVDEARVGQEVCIRIDPLEGETPKLYGRHFDHEDEIVSKISRESIDVMKEYFRNDLSKDDWRLIVDLKKKLGIL